MKILLLLFLVSWAIAHPTGESHRDKRQAAKLSTKWTNGQVNYYFGGTPLRDRRPMILNQMNYIQNRTCIKFVENKDAWQRIKIDLNDFTSCRSKVGAPGSRSNPGGEEVLEVGHCAIIFGTHIHELMHSLGIIHEHQRPDRDDKLNISQAEVVRRGLQIDMGIANWGTTSLLTPFDHGSVMAYDINHYEPPIMSAKDKDSDYTLGNRRVSFHDMYKVNKFYECSCPKELPCQNGGYTNPGDCSKCNCPRGWFGALCNEAPCGGSCVLQAKPEWQTKTVNTSYQFTGDNMDGFTSYFHHIQAPYGMTIEIKIEKLDKFICRSSCNHNGIEIKYRMDHTTTNPLICCLNEKQPFAQKVISSVKNPTVIEVYSKDRTEPAAATFSYRYIDEAIRFG
ncbi:hypothetical protein B9Z55_021332 [Caenorhabditis nigoni]|uniref:Zinc metalloproteinase n=1 Tax=Caenorhabditis nigoni TaxID=1611254 RepID=A0A2G5TS51_9PELO|nr:hypothetical protein B9Z55_021332 [Caenorhabditis nigoni]